MLCILNIIRLVYFSPGEEDINPARVDGKNVIKFSLNNNFFFSSLEAKRLLKRFIVIVLRIPFFLYYYYFFFFKQICFILSKCRLLCFHSETPSRSTSTTLNFEIVSKFPSSYSSVHFKVSLENYRSIRQFKSLSCTTSEIYASGE